MAMEFVDTLDLMQSLCAKVTLTTMGVTDHWNILNDQQVLTLTITPSHASAACAFFAADIVYHGHSLSNYSLFIIRDGWLPILNIEFHGKVSL